MARSYTDADRVRALAALEVNAGNVSRASREVSIPRPTIIAWRDQALAAEPALTPSLTPADTEKTDWGAVMSEALAEAVRYLRAQLPEMKGRDLAITTGILADKHLDYTQGRKGATVNVSASAQAGVVIQRNTRALNG